jgi:hypothetical protein
MIDNPTPPDPIFVKMDQLLAQMQRSIEELRTAMFVLAQIPPDDMTKHEQRAHKSNLVHKVMTGLVAGNLPGRLMSGRWHRRNGDSYGILRQPGEPNPEKVTDVHNLPVDKRE